MQLSRALVRRIDRLALRAHAFHRYAHHPLCERYRGELIAVRARTRVCRGCAYALLGACSGGVLGLALSGLPALPLLAAGASGLMWALFGLQRLRRTRPNKLASRALPAFVLACALVALAHAGSPLVLLPLAAAISCYLVYRRRGPDRTPCRTCPEQTRQPCSGYLPMVRAERAFVRRAQHLIDLEVAGGSP